MSHHEPTIASILRRLAVEFDGPVEERRVLERVLEQRPSSAKNPFATIRERLRGDELRLGWLRLGRGRLMPLHVILTGLRFRCLPAPRDLEAGLLPITLLQPFAGGRAYEPPAPGQGIAACTLRDAAGTPMAAVGTPDDPAFDLAIWYARSGFRPGDSIAVTVTAADPLTMLIEREPRESFRADAVAAQDAELIAAIVERVYEAQTALVPCDEALLAIFAAAPWRVAYPGTPWQQLVADDGRLQLVDEIFLARQLHAPRQPGDAFAPDAALLGEIDALQGELRRARQRDAEAGLWSGQIQRASAAFGAFEHDLARHPLFGRLEELSGGEWSVDEPWESASPLDEDEIDPNDPATLRAARDRMRELLPPADLARLEEARPDEAELIVARNLNMLLSKAPELFPRIDLIPPDEDDPPVEAAFAEDWQDAWDDDEPDELAEDDGDDPGDAFAQSGDLIGQFYDYLLEMGKSEATARVRARALNVYADFLASYYGRSLAEGDYATLDECLFYYYPRQVMHTSARQVREICTAIKQLYAFLKQRGIISDDRFAEALWRRRDQAARVVEIYDRIAGDAPGFETLFERLFQPYTE
jgi:hypothetical protein